MGQLGGLKQVAFLDQLQPVRDVVVDRAFPFAKRVAAGQASSGLLAGCLGVVRSIDLREVATRVSTGNFAGSCVGCPGIEEFYPPWGAVLVFIGLAARQAARRRFSISESMEAAFGFTTQNLPM